MFPRKKLGILIQVCLQEVNNIVKTKFKLKNVIANLKNLTVLIINF
jgi:hypothetical protein